ncbi:nucleoside phosphorylase [Nitratireductor aquimarinus]|uniref:nucleoside phosphorylase n=1 Tax=Nitratireductor aquimarinus TaxID=889300 RepID=UPI001A8FF4F2|nr:nucleoside phosphorylase [Nitratireductor aquimarinus]MBN8244219.1 nucleoside phosphorylase [Nitratireductor aquimarinus]MBY6132609.1 nucleoside phosphorylase [Nitratireductor aquimarinus]MCA1304588.1 nucleoside phosphorylase [Nitratireductor aquimarinus]
MADSAKPTARLPFSGGRPPHLPCGPGDVAEDVLVPGDPDRVALLRDMLTDVQDFGRKREFALVTGTFEGRRLTICSSGIGGPSTEIAMVELAMLGAKRLIRIGGCSALVPEIPTGDYIVPHTATGLTGVAALYAEHGYTPEADPALASALEESAAALGLGAHRGMIASTDSYYLGQDRPLRLDAVDSPDAGYLDRFLAEGAIGVEMESQVILAVGRALGLRAACLLGVHGNRATDNWLVDYENTQRNLLRIAGRALAHDASQ